MGSSPGDPSDATDKVMSAGIADRQFQPNGLGELDLAATGARRWAETCPTDLWHDDA